MARQTKLASIVERSGKSQADLAKEVGLSQPAVNRHIKGERGITAKQATRYAIALGCSPQDILFDAAVQIVGYITAGSAAQFPEPTTLGMARMPQNASDRTVAVEVRGDSLGPAFDRWIIYYDDRRDPPSLDLIGELCVVGLANGEVKVKMLEQGRQEGRFNLLSNSGGGMERDREVLWAAKVIGMMRGDLARLEDFEAQGETAPSPQKKQRRRLR